MAAVIETDLVEPVAFTPFAAWPGREEARGIFVRRTPVLDATATRTLYVHGLGGSSLNFTDLMKLRMPTKLGYKNPKYIQAIFVTNTYPGGYWEDQGYNWFGGS